MKSGAATGTRAVVSGGRGKDAGATRQYGMRPRVGVRAVEW